MKTKITHPNPNPERYASLRPSNLVDPFVEQLKNYEALVTRDETYRLYDLPNYLWHQVELVRGTFGKRTQDVVSCCLDVSSAQLLSLPAVARIKAVRHTVLESGHECIAYVSKWEYNVDLQQRGQGHRATRVPDEVQQHVAALGGTLGLTRDVIVPVCLANSLRGVPTLPDFAREWMQAEVKKFLDRVEARADWLEQVTRGLQPAVVTGRAFPADDD